MKSVLGVMVFTLIVFLMLSYGMYSEAAIDVGYDEDLLRLYGIE